MDLPFVNVLCAHSVVPALSVRCGARVCAYAHACLCMGVACVPCCVYVCEHTWWSIVYICCMDYGGRACAHVHVTRVCARLTVHDWRGACRMCAVRVCCWPPAASRPRLPAGPSLPCALQHHKQRHQSEVIRPIVLEHSLYLLYGLWVDGRSAAPQAKASVFGRMAAEAQGKAASLARTFELFDRDA